MQTATGLLAAVVIGLLLCWIIMTLVIPRLGI
jgi:tetrahydromethanopterin S-methyltransferase subunit G